MDPERMEQEQGADRCPVCGGDNHCAMAATARAADCWCRSVTISPQTLASIPADAIGKRCLCPRCARTGGESNHER